MVDAMEEAPVIEARALRKRYGERVAVAEIDLAVNRGEIVGLLGPNGAGKTTTMSILAGVLNRDSGRAAIAGHDLDREPIAARRSLGYVPQSIALYPTMSALENLLFFGRMQGLRAAAARDAAWRMLEQAGLASRARDPVGLYSGGMQRRVNIACGMIHEPPALLLDEPTVGVDPQSRERIFAMVEAAAAAGTAVLYSTNYTEEVERLCSRVILMDHGRVAAHGSTREIIMMAGGGLRVELVTRIEIPPDWAAHLVADRRELARSNGAYHTAFAIAAMDHVPEIIKLARDLEGGLVEFHLHRPNLQDAFLVLTGHGLRDSL
jgi:ABC-2 type transport system ATP-binding protein